MHALRKCGVMLVTGPGATNAVTGLTDALMDSIPLVCLSGQVPSHLIGSDAFQECDTVGITRCCTKHNYLLNPLMNLQVLFMRHFILQLLDALALLSLIFLKIFNLHSVRIKMQHM